MESVFCECKECGALIGRFTNLWTQIGKDLFSPVLEPEGDLAIHCQGHDRFGQRGTIVEDCHVRDITCRNCTAVLGLKCIHTPVNHLLGGGQILLRLASVGLLDSDGHGSEFAIKRILIDEPTMGSNAKVAEPSQGALADRLASATATLGELGQQFAALRTLIHGELCEFESKLRSQYQEMQGLKSDINGSLSATEDAEDMASFRAEMAKMRRQIDEICSRSMGRTEVLPSGELEVLTSNKTGGKADQPTIDQVIRIPKDLQARLLDMEEPERYGTWLRCVFEEDPEVQIDQLALWRAYSASFLGALTRAGRPIISAPEFIQRISAVWPNARPQVIQSGPNREEQKYIVRGIRARSHPITPEGQAYLKCHWQRGPGQPVKCGFWSLTAEKMWEHVLSKHVNVTGTKEGVHRTREIEASQRGLDSLEKQIVKREVSGQAGDDPRQSRNMGAGDLVELLPGSRKRPASPRLDHLSKRPAHSVGHPHFPGRKDRGPSMPVNRLVTTDQGQASDGDDASHLTPGYQRKKSPGTRTTSASDRLSAFPL